MSVKIPKQPKGGKHHVVPEEESNNDPKKDNADVRADIETEKAAINANVEALKKALPPPAAPSPPVPKQPSVPLNVVIDDDKSGKERPATPEEIAAVLAAHSQQLAANGPNPQVVAAERGAAEALDTANKREEDEKSSKKKEKRKLSEEEEKAAKKRRKEAEEKRRIDAEREKQDERIEAMVEARLKKARGMSFSGGLTLNIGNDVGKWCTDKVEKMLDKLS